MEKIKNLLLASIASIIAFSAVPAFANSVTVNADGAYGIGNQCSSGYTWSQIRNLTGSTMTAPCQYVSNGVGLQEYGQNDQIHGSIFRIGMAFNTNGVLTSGETMTGADLCVYALAHSGTPAETSQVVKYTGSSTTVFTINDFSMLPDRTSIPATGGLLSASMNLSAYNCTPLNSTGLSWIKLNGETGLGLRFAYDVDNNSASQSMLTTRIDSATGSNPPYLKIYYSVASSSSSSIATGTGNLAEYTGSELITKSYCETFNGTGSDSTCTEYDTSIEVGALSFFTAAVEYDIIKGILFWLEVVGATAFVILISRYFWRIFTQKRR